MMKITEYCKNIVFLVSFTRQIQFFYIILFGIFFFVYGCSESLDKQKLADIKPLPATETDLLTNRTTANTEAVLRAKISFPPQDITLSTGASIAFSGVVVGNQPEETFAFHWNFDGVMANQRVQNPKDISFSTPGTYSILLTIQSNVDKSRFASVTRRVIVLDASQNKAPVANIVIPDKHITVNLGDSVSFLGEGFDPDQHLPLTYYWDFGGAATNTRLANPGEILMQRGGHFKVNLYVFDRQGLADTTPASVLVTVNPKIKVAQTVLGNLAPESSITSPLNDVTILQGDSITFSGLGQDPEGNQPLNYFWSFAGQMPDSLAQSPGDLVFPGEGVFVVELVVTDALGLIDSSPAQRTITVLPNNQQVNVFPDGQILSPTQDVTITAGNSVYFAATASDPDGNLPIKYIWRLGGAMPDIPVQNPGNVTFANAGIYIVGLLVVDSAGGIDQVVDQRIITVNGLVPANADALDSIITSPAADLTILAGSEVEFEGMGVLGPDNIEPLTYAWDFAGAAEPSTLQSPGDILFNDPGEYIVTFTVTDGAGVVDDTPATVIVTVEAPPPADPPPADPPPLVDPPPVDVLTATIVSPGEDLTISVGDTVNFVGEAVDPAPDTTLTFEWDFDGGAPDSDAQSPGNVTFDILGMFEVVLEVSNNLAAEAESGPRMITVVEDASADPPPAVDPTPPPAGTPPADPGVAVEPPDSVILSPDADLSILAGEVLSFSGEGTSNNPDAVLSYAWEFGDAMPEESVEQNPGDVLFTEPGIYEVTLTVIDETNGLEDPSPAMVIITVEAPPL